MAESSPGVNAPLPGQLTVAVLRAALTDADPNAIVGLRDGPALRSLRLYGPAAPPPLRGVCFVERAQPRCLGPYQCAAVMTHERRQLWERLQAMAGGDVGSWEDAMAAVLQACRESQP